MIDNSSAALTVPEPVRLFAIMTVKVRFQAVLGSEGLVARCIGIGAAIGFLSRMGSDMGLEVVGSGKRLATSLLLTFVWFLSSMGARVFPEVREGGEELEAPILHAVESVARVESLVSLQSVESVECLVAA